MKLLGGETNESETAKKIGKLVGNLCADGGEKYSKPKEHRLLMSLCAEVVSRNEMQLLMNCKISRYEWNIAKAHARYPGPGLPVKPNHFNCKKISDAKLDHLLSWVARSNLTQDLAYGHKTFVFQNGWHIAIASVKRTTTLKKIIQLYYNEFVLPDYPKDENFVLLDKDCNENDVGGCNGNGDDKAMLCELVDQLNIVGGEGRCVARCKCICPKFGFRCLGAEHSNVLKHKFVPRNLLGLTTISRIMKSITSGTIKLLQGLDDIDLQKGAENFEKMKGLVNLLSIFAGKTSPEEMNEAKVLVREIDQVQDFHKMDFHCHLDLKHTGVPAICACTQCVFSESKAACPFHASGNHTGPCAQCQKGFDIIGRLWDLYHAADDRLKIQKEDCH